MTLITFGYFVIQLRNECLFLGSLGIVTNRVNREAVLGRFVYSALRFIKAYPERQISVEGDSMPQIGM